MPIQTLRLSFFFLEWYDHGEWGWRDDFLDKNKRELLSSVQVEHSQIAVAIQ